MWGSAMSSTSHRPPTVMQLLRFAIPQRGDPCRALPWTELTGSKGVPGAPPALATVATNEAAVAHLAPALVKFFVDIEFTGSHTQVRCCCCC
jgi:hypothetical protein